MPTRLVLFLLFASALSSFSWGDLERRVAQYWDFLAKRDKASALELVSRQSQNAFINRREPPMGSWRIVSIEPRSADEAVVTVEVEQAFLGIAGMLKAPVYETWIREDGVWKVRVNEAKPEDALAQFRYTPSAEAAPEKGLVEIVPHKLKIHFLDRAQLGGVRLANGLDEAVEIEGVEYDQSRFELNESPAAVPPGQYGVFNLRYTGKDNAKEQLSSMTIVARWGDRETVFEVPVLFNHLDAATRGLFGLTPEKAEKLTREDKLVPVLQAPQDSEEMIELKKRLQREKPDASPSPRPPLG